MKSKNEGQKTFLGEYRRSGTKNLRANRKFAGCPRRREQGGEFPYMSEDRFYSAKAHERKKIFARGYIAITSAIIISFLLMTIVFTLSSASFFSRSNILDSNQKETSLGIAEACADTALLKLAQNSAYSGNENLNVGSSTCSILSLESPSGQKIIKTWANYKGYQTNIKITLNYPAMTIISWEELPNF